MKKNQLSLLFKASLFMLALMFVFSACKKDDDPVIPPVLTEDGMYIKGEATPYTDLTTKAMFVKGINEANTQTERAGMFEKYTTLKAGSTFTIVEVSGTTQTTWGPATNEVVTLAGENDQIRADIQKGTLGNTGTFTVPADGMYHVVIDKPTGTYFIAPVAWGIIGGFSGWANTPMPQVGAFNATDMKWEVTGLVMRAGAFKWRYSDGWKIELSGDSIKANTNFGGVLSGTLPNLTTTLVPGGSDIALTTDQEGIYTATITWNYATGYTSSLLKTADAPVLDYPTELYLVGASVGGWNWGLNGIQMIPVNSKPHLFWKIVYVNADATDPGIKFNPDTTSWDNAFGVTGAAVDQIYAKGNDNLIPEGTSGYKMITVNFETGQIAVTEPLVYLIGDAVGGYTEAVAENLFTVDNANQTLTITKDLVAAPLRMYATMDKGGWFAAGSWWQSEFMIIDGVIQYRGTGGDQPAVNVTGGNTTIKLNFVEETGSITNN